MTLYVSVGAHWARPRATAYYAAELVTHEYAHHVQSLSGIINAAFQVSGSHRRVLPSDRDACPLPVVRADHPRPGVRRRRPRTSAVPQRLGPGPGNAKFGSIASQQAYGEKGLAATKVGDCDAFSAPTVS